MGKGLFLHKDQSVKNETGDYFFQMHKSWQPKNNKAYEEKGKHGPIKGTNLHKLTLKKWKSMNYPTKSSEY